MSDYLPALLLTLAVEPPLYCIALRYIGEPRWWRGYGLGLLVNGTSHPLTWLVLWHLLTGAGVPKPVAFPAVEAFAVTWEAALLYAYLRRDLALLAGVSFAVNGVSLALGAVVFR